MKIIVTVALLTICYVLCMDLVNKFVSNIDFEKIGNGNETTTESNIYSVSISGSVTNPGTYTVTKDSTLGYLITLAGGLKDEADITAFNSNAIIKNGASYYIPYKKLYDDGTSQKISINSATQAALDTLPGIGTVFSKRIIEYRTTNGPFKTIEDLKNVKGIGDSLFETIKDLICL